MEAARCFNTFKNSDEFENFINFDAAEGDIVVAACNDDCIARMSDKGKQWFQDMGSMYIRNLDYR